MSDENKVETSEDGRYWTFFVTCLDAGNEYGDTQIAKVHKGQTPHEVADYLSMSYFGTDDDDDDDPLDKDGKWHVHPCGRYTYAYPRRPIDNDDLKVLRKYY